MSKKANAETNLSLHFFLGYGDAGWMPIENLKDEYKDLENTIIGKLPQKAYHKPGHPTRFEIMYSKEFIFLGFYNDGPLK